MTYEKVLQVVNTHDTSLGFWKMVKAAVEKQIPKKPIHMHKNFYCPVCKEDGWVLWDDAVPNELDKYCGKCGQRLDWSDWK